MERRFPLAKNVFSQAREKAICAIPPRASRAPDSDAHPRTGIGADQTDFLGSLEMSTPELIEDARQTPGNPY